MAKRKVRPHPGALAEVLKRLNMTQTVAAKGVVDRKTLAKIDRGEEVKEETLQRLAKKLNVPATYFEPPASSVHQELGELPPSQPDDPKWLNLTLRNLDAEGLAEMFSPLGPEAINWRLNVRAVDDETIQLLEQLEDAINELRTHHSHIGDGTLRFELEFLKKTRRVASLLEELAKRHVTIVGAEYLVWNSHEELIYPDGRDGIDYRSTSYVALSIETHPAQARREKVWQGTVPPKFSLAGTPIMVNGHRLPRLQPVPYDEDDEVPF